MSSSETIIYTENSEDSVIWPLINNNKKSILYNNERKNIKINQNIQDECKPECSKDYKVETLFKAKRKKSQIFLQISESWNNILNKQIIRKKDQLRVNEPKPLMEIMRSDSVLQSLEELNKNLIEKQETVIDSFANFYNNKNLEKCVDVLKSIKKSPINTIPPPNDLSVLRHNEDLSEYCHVIIPPTETYYAYPSIEEYREQRYREYRDYRIRYMGPFNLKGVRNLYLSKVYTLLTLQMIFTFAFVLLCTNVRSVENFVVNQNIPLVFACIIAGVLELFIFFSVSLRREYPLNLNVLLVLCVSFTYIIGVIACYCQKETVVYATGSSALIFLCMSLISSLNWFDITHWTCTMILLGLIIMGFGIASVFTHAFTEQHSMWVINAFLIVILLMIYILYDLNQLVKGNRVIMSSDEYILGVLTLYVDIIIICVCILLCSTVRHE